MDTLDQSLAARVRSLRQDAGLSLAELAQRSGVSRAMLSRIERCEASPTAQLLNRLCGALDISLSRFFASEAEAPPLTRHPDQPVWCDPQSGYVRRAVSSPDPQGGSDLVEIMLPAGASVRFDNALLGHVTQIVWLLEGAIDIEADHRITRLHPGDSLRMRLHAPTGFTNPGTTPARYAVILERRKP